MHRRRQNKKMNFKKAISISFLLFANIAILVHVVLFHHHESQLSAAICAENLTHQCSESTHKYPANDNANNYPVNERAHKCCTIDNCILNDVISKAGGYKLSEPVFNNINVIVNNNPACHSFLITYLTGLPFRQKPYQPFFYDDFISQSLGLRAPPAC